jgi:hypothetical protein
LLDHIIEHLTLADAFAANAARIAARKSRSKHSQELWRHCCGAADRERAEAAAHARNFGIAHLLLRQELATWRRLRQYSLDHVEALTVADVRWLKAVLRHGRCGSRNVRRAAELLHLVQAFLLGSAGGPTSDCPGAQAPPRNFADFAPGRQIVGRGD